MENQLKATWQSRREPPPAATVLENELDLGPTDDLHETRQWLVDFSRLFFADDNQVDPELMQMALEALDLVKDPSTTALIKDLQTKLNQELTPTNQPPETQRRLLQRVRQSVRQSLHRLSLQRDFDRLIQHFQEKDQVPLMLLAAEQTERQAQGKITQLDPLAPDTAPTVFAEYQRQVQLRPELVRVISEVEDLHVDLPVLQEQLLVLLAASNEPLAQWQAEWTTIRDLIAQLEFATDGHQLFTLLEKYQLLLRQSPIGQDRTCKRLIDNPQLAIRATARERQQYIEALHTASAQLDLTKMGYTEAAKLNLISPDAAGRLGRSQEWYELYLKVQQLTECCDRLAVSKKLKQQVLARCLHGSPTTKHMPATLVQDIIEGRLHPEDILLYGLVEWAAATSPSTDPKQSREWTADRLVTVLKRAGLSTVGIVVAREIAEYADGDPRKLLEKLLEIIKDLDPRAILLILGFVLATVGGKLLLHKLGISLGRERGGGGGASLTFGSPFENKGNAFSRKKEWELIDIPPTSNSSYFRTGSTSTFNKETLSWENDTVIGEHNHDTGVDTRTAGKQAFGKVAGQFHRKATGFEALPLPYGTVVTHHTSKGGTKGSFYPDRAGDGSLGFDFANRSEALVPTEIDHPEFSGSSRYSPRDKMATYYQKNPFKFDLMAVSTPLIELYPFTNPQSTDVILPATELPRAAQLFFKKLDSLALSKAEEAAAITEFVQKEFIYSIDPSTNKIYQAAQQQGAKAFFNTLFEVRKVKCDGAATAAILLMRARGIPCRMAVGYQRDEGASSLQAKDHHGWVEAEIEGQLLRFDPTPTVTDAHFRRAHRLSSLLDVMSYLHQVKKESIQDLSKSNEAKLKQIWHSADVSSSLLRNLSVPITNLYYGEYSRGLSRSEKRQFYQQALTDQASLNQVEAALSQREHVTLTDVITLLSEHGFLSKEQFDQGFLEHNYYRSVELLVVPLVKQHLPLEVIPNRESYPEVGIENGYYTDTNESYTSQLEFRVFDAFGSLVTNNQALLNPNLPATERLNLIIDQVKVCLQAYLVDSFLNRPRKKYQRHFEQAKAELEKEIADRLFPLITANHPLVILTDNMLRQQQKWRSM